MPQNPKLEKWAESKASEVRNTYCNKLWTLARSGIPCARTNRAGTLYQFPVLQGLLNLSELAGSKVDSIDKSARVIPVDRPIVEKAASLKAGRGIPYIDSIILSTFMLTGCREIHTTDRNHFTEIKNKDLSFVFY